MRLQTRGFQQTGRFRSDCHAPCWGWCLTICALIGYVGKLDLASSGPFSRIVLSAAVAATVGPRQP